jgi:hypothetical protein
MRSFHCDSNSCIYVSPNFRTILLHAVCRKNSPCVSISHPAAGRRYTHCKPSMNDATDLLEHSHFRKGLLIQKRCQCIVCAAGTEQTSLQSHQVALFAPVTDSGYGSQRFAGPLPNMAHCPPLSWAHDVNHEFWTSLSDSRTVTGHSGWHTRAGGPSLSWQPPWCGRALQTL